MKQIWCNKVDLIDNLRYLFNFPVPSLGFTASPTQKPLQQDHPLVVKGFSGPSLKPLPLPLCGLLPAPPHTSTASWGPPFIPAPLVLTHILLLVTWLASSFLVCAPSPLTLASVSKEGQLSLKPWNLSLLALRAGARQWPAKEIL